MTKAELDTWLASRTYEEGDCLIWTKVVCDGAPKAWVNGKSRRVRRVVFERSNKTAVSAEQVIIASCATPRCVRAEHLVAVTKSQFSLLNHERGCYNVAAFRLTMTRANRRRSTKLTMDAARSIRTRRSNGETYAAIAEAYGVAQSCVRKICNHKLWVDAGPFAQLVGRA